MCAIISSLKEIPEKVMFESSHKNINSITKGRKFFEGKFWWIWWWQTFKFGSVLFVHLYSIEIWFIWKAKHFTPYIWCLHMLQQLSQAFSPQYLEILRLYDEQGLWSVSQFAQGLLLTIQGRNGFREVGAALCGLGLAGCKFEISMWQVESLRPWWEGMSFKKWV